MKNMIYIAICDDEEIPIRYIKNKLEQELQKMEVTSYQLDIYYSGVDLLKNKKTYDILLLDIEMPEMDGFSVAKGMNQLKKKPLIIFLTSHREFMSKGYHVKAFRYLLKPISDQEFQEAIFSAIKEITSFQGVMKKTEKAKKSSISMKSCILKH